jgi:hypothetical protein
MLLGKALNLNSNPASTGSRDNRGKIRRFRDFIKDASRRFRAPFDRRRGAMLRLNEYHSKGRTIEEVIHWVMNFGGGGYFTIKTMQIPSEITALAQRVRELNPQMILEIGTMRGGTLLIWTQLASERVSHAT